MRLSRLAFALVLVVTLVTSTFAAGSVHVRGYTRKDGTYVAPHERSAPNSTKSDNYSTKGNVNPYTGKPGTKPGDSSGSSASSASSPAAPAAGSDATPANPEKPSQPEATTPKIDLGQIKIGMTKQEVVTALGKPNMESPRIWFYSGGGFVRFTDDKVRNIEPR